MERKPENKGELDNLREQIDSVDRQIIDLLAKRMDLVGKVGEFKHKNNLPPLDAARWQQVLTSRKEQAQALGVSPELIEKIFDCIHQTALDIEASSGSQEENQ